MIKLCGFAVSNYYNKVKLALIEKEIAFEELPPIPVVKPVAPQPIKPEKRDEKKADKKSDKKLDGKIDASKAVGAAKPKPILGPPIDKMTPPGDILPPPTDPPMPN